MTLLIYLVILAPLIDLVACAYIWNLYQRDERRPRSWILRSFAWTATLQTLAAAWIAAVAIASLSSVRLPYATELLAVAILLIQAGPPYLAYEVFRRERKDRRVAE